MSKNLGFFNYFTSAWLEKIFYFCCVIVVVINLFISKHSQHDWEQIPAFYAIFSLLACLALIMLTKLLLILVKRGEDYYDA